MYYFSKPISAGYNTVKDNLSSAGKVLGLLGGAVGLGALLAACGGKEATPTQIASTPPSEPGATVQAPHNLTPEAYGLVPIPTPEIKQTDSDLASKARKVYDLIKSQTPKEGVRYIDMGYHPNGDHAIRAEIVIGGVHYAVEVGKYIFLGDLSDKREKNEGTGFATTLILRGGVVVTADMGGPGSDADGILDGQVDFGWIEDASIITGKDSYFRNEIFNRYRKENPDFEEGLQGIHKESLEAILRFFEN